MTRTKAVVRVQKLLTLADGTSFSGERQSAAWKAFELSRQYELDDVFFGHLWSVGVRCVAESLAESQIRLPSRGIP